MELIEITPEKDKWITQKSLYEYDIKLGSLFAVIDEDLDAIYYYEIDGYTTELPDECETWEEAEDVFLEVMFDHFSDEESYYNSLKLACDELIKERSEC